MSWSGLFIGCTELSGRGESSELASQSLGRVIRDAVISPSGYSGGVAPIRVFDFISGDVPAGISKGDELAPAGQRYRIVEVTFPSAISH